MKCLLCQTSSVLGDFKHNQKKILDQAKKYSHCDLLIFPELFLMGYPPEDLLELKFILQEQQKLIQQIKSKKIKPALLFGACSLEKNSLYNSAVLVQKKSVKKIHKTDLACTDTFDEMRFFTSGDSQNKVVKIKNKNVLVLICEDLWKMHLKKSPSQKIDLIVCINSSPFFLEQFKSRKTYAQKLCQKLKAPLIYLNQVGGQDEWIFDGSSFVLNQKGESVFQAPHFKENFSEIDTTQLNKKISLPKKNPLVLKKEALILAIRDYIQKNNIQKVHFGLSGGIDSALILFLCKEALSSSNLKAFYLEGPHSSAKSKQLSQALAQEQNIEWKNISITSSYKHILPLFKKVSNIAQQNIQARLRNLFLMTYSNTTASLLIGTCNKSELSTGYSTLYGDLAGGILPIGDLYKTEIQQMAKLFSSPTLKKILKRNPSAELAPQQTDEADLYPYQILDPILKNIIEKHQKPKTPLEKKIFSQILKFEFKRRQSPLIFKVSSKSFGRGRRYPISLYR